MRIRIALIALLALAACSSGTDAPPAPVYVIVDTFDGGSHTHTVRMPDAVVLEAGQPVVLDFDGQAVAFRDWQPIPAGPDADAVPGELTRQPDALYYALEVDGRKVNGFVQVETGNDVARIQVWYALNARRDNVLVSTIGRYALR